MAKYYGNVGYAEFDYNTPGVVKEEIVERPYYGDFFQNTRRLQSANQVNDNLSVSNRISIVSDPYANKNFHLIRYATYMGVKWEVTSVDVAYPRLTLNLGGVYNDEGGASSDSM